MKYTFETQRTYVTEVTIIADSKEEAWEWVYNNSQSIAEAELEQMSVVHEESIMRVQDDSNQERNVYDQINQRKDMLKLLNEYCDAKNEILKLTNEYYDAMAYDIEGWEEFIEDGDIEESDMEELRLQVQSAKDLFKALSRLKYRFS